MDEIDAVSDLSVFVTADLVGYAGLSQAFLPFAVATTRSIES